MTTFKDDNEKAENHEEALEDPNFDEYHSMKGKEEDEKCKSKTIQNRTHSQPSHMVDPAVSDRHGQVAVTRSTQLTKNWKDCQSVPVTGKGS